MTEPAYPMEPAPARVLEVHRETADVVTLTLAPLAPPARPFVPGQFAMFYVFGVGEVPLALSGPPSRTEVAMCTVRAVGPVTRALCGLTRGDLIGLRGPFGTPWPMDDPASPDLVLVAGGLGLIPLRPVVYRALEQRPRHGRISLLVGARSPDDLLYREELAAWQRRDDITVLVTVDRAPGGWTGRVGVVPALLSEVDIAPDRTAALVCGPEVMMRFTVRELGRRDLPDHRIHLSMERNMKCAVGWCGHCQFGPSFICKDGPVLSYDRIRPRFWLREI